MLHHRGRNAEIIRCGELAGATDAAAFQIDEDHAVGLPFAPGPIINVQNARRRLLYWSRSSNATQQS